jgi:hypothetical protein
MPQRSGPTLARRQSGAPTLLIAPVSISSFRSRAKSRQQSAKSEKSCFAVCARSPRRERDASKERSRRGLAGARTLSRLSTSHTRRKSSYREKACSPMRQHGLAWKLCVFICQHGCPNRDGRPVGRSAISYSNATPSRLVSASQPSAASLHLCRYPNGHRRSSAFSALQRKSRRRASSTTSSVVRISVTNGGWGAV